MAKVVAPFVQLPDGSSRPVTCTQCGTTQFVEHVTKTSGRWGLTQHKMTLLECVVCCQVLTFYDNRVIFFQTS